MLKAYPVPGKAKSAMLCQAFIDGAPKDAKGSVFYGVKAGNFEDWKRVRASGEDWYFIDNSYFDGASRGVQFRVTKNRLQHTGLGESTGERFSRLGIAIQPPRIVKNGHAVFVEQSPDHMHYTLMGDRFLDSVLPYYKDEPTFRWRQWSADKPKIQTTLADDLAGARVLITHTSAAAIMAQLAGMPTMCSPLCAASQGLWDRYQWASILADHQFDLTEMKEGLAWRTLNP